MSSWIKELNLLKAASKKEKHENPPPLQKKKTQKLRTEQFDQIEYIYKIKNGITADVSCDHDLNARSQRSQGSLCDKLSYLKS